MVGPGQPSLLRKIEVSRRKELTTIDEENCLQKAQPASGSLRQFITSCSQSAISAGCTLTSHERQAMALLQKEYGLDPEGK